MKIIDLLNKIANGEEVPKKIKYDDNIYEYDYNEKNYSYLFIDYYRYLFDDEITQILDDEVEVIEDNKKIEHIGKEYDITDFKCEYPKVAELVKDLSNKQYEIIDKLNEVLNDKD